MKLMQSGAFAHLMQGMLNNYTEFLTQASQDATHEVIDAMDARVRRVRQAA